MTLIFQGHVTSSVTWPIRFAIRHFLSASFCSFSVRRTV